MSQSDTFGYLMPKVALETYGVPPGGRSPVHKF
jgi:hypothetical protein